jgi:hypothetical protein
MGGLLVSTTALAGPGHAATETSSVGGSEGRGLLATWYDIEPGREAEYLAWANAVYFPALARRKGYQWVAHYRTLADDKQQAVDGGDSKLVAYTQQMRQVDKSSAEFGQGSKFLLLVGAKDPTVFLSPYHAIEDDRLGGAAQKMLALRRGLRTSMFDDIVRQPGPSHLQFARGMPSARIQMGGLRTLNNAETDLLRWYVDERFPLLEKLDGMISARLLAGCTGWERYGVLYEFADKAAHARFRHQAEQVTMDGAISGKTLFPVGRVVQSPHGPIVADRIWPEA